jgi:alkanesulfonate monooxygenase SsuD/methylene tetrahydromethanopterin reductase-like flavin-dependent oxidoreductase (luciferase family)
VPLAAAVGEHLEQVRLARAVGFRSIWAGQHFLSSPFGMLQTVPLLARLAAAAEGMTVGTAVLLLPLLNPVELAEQAATLDAIAGGRFVLGVGLGYRAVENDAFGVGGDRGALLERKLDVVVRLLAGQAVKASGPGYRLDGVTLGVVPPAPPPLWLAANADAAVRRAARLADAWLINPHTHLGELERQARLFREERARARRAPVDGLPVLKEVCVAETDAAALAAARPHLARKYEAYVAWGQDAVLPGGDALDVAWERLSAGGRFVIGSPETCAAILREHVRRVGVREILCRVQWPGMPQEHVLRSIRLLGDAVAPALAAA